MISIVLPVYNGEKYLAEAIHSIQNQSYSDFELIIVNDCSTDSTKDIAENFLKKDTRIRLINNEDNLRLPASLNVGFKNSKGDFLTWTSDDNILYPNMFRKLLDRLEEGFEFAYADMDYIGSKGERLNNISHIGDDIWYSNNIGACFLYTRKAYETVGEYNTFAFLVEDYEYWLRIASNFKISFINEKLYGYRLHEASLTGSRQKDIALKRIDLLNTYINDPSVSLKVKNKIRVQLANTFYDLGNRNRVIEYLDFLRKNDISEYRMTRKATRLNQFLNKRIIETLRFIKRGV